MPEQEALAPADAALPRVVLFDFDGVLIRGDSFYLFMRERYRRSWWRRLLAVLSTPLLLLQLPFSRRLPMHTLVRIALLGLGEQGYQVAANAFAATLARRPKQFCRDGLQALRRHQAQGARHGLSEWQVAYGDSMYDAAMLKLAAEAVLVNGTPTLCKKVEKALGRAVTRVEWF